MDDIETGKIEAGVYEPVESKRSNAWLAASTCSALALLAAIGFAFPMREHILAQAHDEIRAQTSEREKLGARIDALQSRLANASPSANSNDEAVTELTAKLTEATGKLDALNARVEALEKKPETAPAIPAPVAVAPVAAAPVAAAALTPLDNSAALKLAALSGKGFSGELAAWQKLHPDAREESTALNAVAESGILSEAAMNQKLRETLDAAMAARKVDDVSLVGKINTHLAGLVSIKKASDTGPYSELRRDVLRDDTATLIQKIEAMDPATRQPLEPWLKTAYARRDALTALNALDTGASR